MLRRRASARGRVFTTADALESGYTRGRARHLVATGAWRRLRRGVFVEVAVLERAHAAELFRMRTAAAVAATTQTWASHESAAAVLGLERLGAPKLDRVELTRPATGTARGRRLGDLVVYECELPVPQRSVRRGIRTTTPARTAVDVARHGELLEGVVVLDSAMRTQRLRRADIAAALSGCAGWPGSAVAADALELSDPLAESVLESVSRVELVRRGLTPETQCWLSVPGGRAVRVDFLWWRERTVGEADGLGKYTKYGPTGRLDPLQTGKLRQDVLEDCGLEVVRGGWRELRRSPDTVADRVRRGFARSLVRQQIRAANGEVDVVRRLAGAPWDFEE